MKNLSLYIGAFMCCTVVLLIPGIIFIAFWAISRLTEEKTVNHIHHQQEQESKVDIFLRENPQIYDARSNYMNNKFEGNIVG